MLERQKKTGIAIMIAGAIIVALTFIINTEAFQSGLMSGGGAALFVVGLARILKAYRLGKNPEKATEYENSFKDERALFISGKAGKVAMFVAVYAEILAGVVAAFAFDDTVVCQVLCYAACFQCLLYYIVFMIYNKKC